MISTKYCVRLSVAPAIGLILVSSPQSEKSNSTAGHENDSSMNQVAVNTRSEPCAIRRLLNQANSIAKHRAYAPLRCFIGKHREHGLRRIPNLGSVTKIARGKQGNFIPV